jgi:hypothetical protein
MDHSSNTFARSLHDVGLAAWFGGSLMGAIGLNSSGASAADDDESTDVAGAGWSAWTPVNLAAIGAYVAGGAVLTVSNRKRLAAQKGVGTTAIVKTALSAVALAATGYSRVIGQRVIDAYAETAVDGTTPTEETSDDVAAAQLQLKKLQWVIPATTGAIIVTSAVMGEQQRPAQVAGGLAERLGERLHLAA